MDLSRLGDLPTKKAPLKLDASARPSLVHRLRGNDAIATKRHLTKSTRSDNCDWAKVKSHERPIIALKIRVR